MKKIAPRKILERKSCNSESDRRIPPLCLAEMVEGNDPIWKKAKKNVNFRSNPVIRLPFSSCGRKNHQTFIKKRSVFLIFVVSIFALTVLRKFISLAVNPSAYNYSAPIFPFLKQNLTTLFVSLLEIAIPTIILDQRSSRLSEQCILTL